MCWIPQLCLVDKEYHLSAEQRWNCLRKELTDTLNEKVSVLCSALEIPRITISTWGEKKKGSSPLLSKFLFIKCDLSFLILKALPTAAVFKVTCVFWNIPVTVPYPCTAGGGEKKEGCFHLCQGKKQLSYSTNHFEPPLNLLLVA